MYTIKTNQEALTDIDGKKYIVNPITKERMHEFVPSLIDNITRTEIEPNLMLISGLYPKIHYQIPNDN